MQETNRLIDEEMGSRHFLTTPKHVPLFISRNLDQNYGAVKSTISCMDDIEFITINQYSDDEPPLIELPFHVKLCICAFLAVSFVIGSFFKAITYAYVFARDAKKEWTHRPINVLIVTSTSIHHVTHGWLVIWFILALMNETSLEDLLDSNWCHVTQNIGVYGTAYLSVGSLGIAIFRVLYIRHESWVKYAIGERALLGIILSLSILISALLTILFTIESSSQRFQNNMCKGISSIHAQILIDYQLYQGEQLLTTAYLQMGVTAVCLAFQTAEFIIYAWFFYYRYQNDNGNMAKLLTEDVIRSRNVKNIGTFVGQFYGFIMEYSFLFLIFLLAFFEDEKNIHLKAILCMIKYIHFGLLSAVEVLSSPNLRAFLKWKVTGN